MSRQTELYERYWRAFDRYRQDRAALGTVLKQARIDRRWSQEDVGRNLHLSRAQINALEEGDLFPSAELIRRLALMFGLNVEKLAKLKFKAKQARPPMKPEEDQLHKSAAASNKEEA